MQEPEADAFVRILRGIAQEEEESIRLFFEQLQVISRIHGEGEGKRALEIFPMAFRIRDRIVDALARRFEEARERSHYRGILNREGSGIVLHAGDAGSGGEFTVKLHLHALSDPSTLARLEAAFGKTASLQHGRLVPIRSLGREGPFFYFVREFIDGGTIPGYTGMDLLDPVDRVNLVREIADAVEFLRQNGIRCEVKPSRIIVDPEGEPFLTDFGVFRSGLLGIGLQPRAVLTDLLLADTAQGPAPGDPTSEEAIVRELGSILRRLFARGEEAPTTGVSGGELFDLPREVPGELRELCERALEPSPETRLLLADLIHRLDRFAIEELARDSMTIFPAADDLLATGHRRRLDEVLTTERIERIAGQIVAASGGRYRNLRCIDKGGMGIIFSAHDTDLDVLRVIKMPLRRALTKETRQEALRLARLRHKNIVTVHELRATEEICFFVMDYLPGKDLEKLCSPENREMEGRRSFPFTPREAAAIVRDIALAVDYLHTQDPPVIHHDIKPKNIQIVDLGASAEVRNAAGDTAGEPATRKEDGKPARWEPVLLDFGICRCLGEGAPGYGSRGWVAPERRSKDGKLGPIGPRSDVWNLGVLLCYLLQKGEVGLGARPDPAGADSTGAGERKPLEVMDSSVGSLQGIPSPLARLIERCVEKEPSKRPTAKMVADSLQTYLEGPQWWKRVALAFIGAAILVVAGYFAYRFISSPKVEGVSLEYIAGERIRVRIRGDFPPGSTVRLAGKTYPASGASRGEIFVDLDREDLGPVRERGRLPLQIRSPHRFPSRTIFLHAGIPPPEIRFSREAISEGIGQDPVAVVYGRHLLGREQRGVAVANRDRKSITVFRAAGDGDLEWVQEIPLEDPPRALVPVDLDRDGIEEIVAATRRNLVTLKHDPRAGTLPIQASIHADLDPASVLSMAAGHFSGRDDWPDLAVAESEWNRVRIFPNAGGQIQAAPTESRFGNIRSPRALAAADFDGDNVRDDLVLISSGHNPPKLQVFLAEENFREPAGSTPNIDATNFALAVANLDFHPGDPGKDRDDDVAVTFNDEIYLYEWKDSELVRFPRSAQPVPHPIFLGAADFTGDGRLEILSIQDNSSELAFLENQGDLAFSVPVFLPVRGTPVSFAIGRLDGDDIPDVVLLAPNQVTVRLGKRKPQGLVGSCSVHAGERLEGPAGVSDLKSGDFDGDGVADLATVQETAGSIAVFLGSRDGFREPRFYTAGDGPQFLEVADLDGDERQDILASNIGSGSIAVLYGRGDGSFEPIPPLDLAGDGVPIPPKPRHMAVADFDGDGRQDIAVAVQGARHQPGWVQILYGSEGRFFDRRQQVIVGVAPRVLIARDLDSDRRVDLLVACEEYGLERRRIEGDETIEGEILVLMNRNGGVFELAQSIGSTEVDNSEPEYLVLKDFNRDGSEDLLVSYRHKVILLKGLGSGKFENFRGASGEDEQVVLGGPLYDPRSDPEFAGAKDLDGDGLPDLILCDEFRNWVLVLKNSGNGSFKIASTLQVGTPQAAVILEQGPFAGSLAAVSRSDDKVLIFRRNPGGFFESEPGLEARVQIPDPVGEPEGLALAAYRSGARAPDTVVVVDEDRGFLDVRRIVNGEVGNVPAIPPIRNPAEVLQPRGVAPTDLNGDDILDLVIRWMDPAENSSSLSILLGQPDGFGFEPGPPLPESISLKSRIVLIAQAWRDGRNLPLDIDGDGRHDLVVAGENNLLLLRGDGAGGFSIESRPSPKGARPGTGLAADLDRDGRPELILIDSRSSHFWVLKDPLGREPEDALPVPLRDPGAHGAIGDFDDDGSPDVAVLHRQAGRLTVLPGRSGWKSADKELLVGAGMDPVAVAAADFDRNGSDDLLVACRSSGEVILLLGDGKGDFPESWRRNFPVGKAPEALAVGDWAGAGGAPDGLPDFLVADGDYGLFLGKNQSSGD